MATEQCVRPVEKSPHERSHEHHLSDGNIQARDAHAQQHQHVAQHDMTKKHAESKTPSHGIHAPQHVAHGMDHGKKEKKMKDKKEKDKDKKEKKDKEKKTEKKKPEKEKKSKNKKCKDDSSD